MKQINNFPYVTGRYVMERNAARIDGTPAFPIGYSSCDQGLVDTFVMGMYNLQQLEFTLDQIEKYTTFSSWLKATHKVKTTQ